MLSNQLLSLHEYGFYGAMNIINHAAVVLLKPCVVLFELCVCCLIYVLGLHGYIIVCY